MKRKTARINQTRRGALFLLPSLVGFVCFFILPFFMILYYSTVNDPIRREFVGLLNYTRLLKNPAFLLGLKNTLIFLGAAAAATLVLSLLLALALRKFYPRSGLLQSVLLFPLTVPVVALLLLVSVFLDFHGAVNALLSALGVQPVSWLDGGWSRVTMLLLFLWKHCGLCALLFLSALQTIPQEEREAATIDGANGPKRFFYVELPHLAPTALFILLVALLFGFRFFREIYLLAGRYPAQEMYLLQHFMHNVFEILDYQKLSAAAVLLFLFTAFVMGALALLGRRMGADSVLSLPHVEPRSGRRRGGTLTVGAVLAVILVIVCLMPSVLTLLHSFAGERELQARYAAVFDWRSLIEEPVKLLLWPEKPGLEGYRTLFADQAALRRIWNSVSLAIPALIGQLLFATGAAYGFARWRGKLRNVLFFLYIVLLLMPYEVTLLPNFLMARWLGVLDTSWAVWLPYWFSPLPVYLLAKQMERVPAELREAAALDGAGEWRLFTRIYLPQIRGTLGITVFLLFIDVWNMTELPLTLLKTDTLQPLSVWLSNVRAGALAPSFAAAVIFSVPPLLLFFAARKRT